MNWKNKIILLTGGTGSFGQKFIDVAVNIFRDLNTMLMNIPRKYTEDIQIFSGKLILLSYILICFAI